jgi:F-type H+-transporting ATPase subunit epsilon
MHVTVISPERTVFDGDAESLVAPAFDGLGGILPGHAPFLSCRRRRLRVAGAGGLEFGVAGGFPVARTRPIVADRHDRRG